MDEYRRRILRLIVLRFVLVCFVVVSTQLALPRRAASTDFLLPFSLAVVVLTAIYLLLWKYSDRLEPLYSVQFYTDLLLLSVLIYFTGGIGSLFTPFYVLVIVYASLFRGRDGGLLAATLSIISYVLIVHLGFLGWVPSAAERLSYRNILYQLSVNLLAFVSVAFLGIYLSERLRSAHRQLGAARAVQENIVNSIRSGLLTLNLQGKVTFFNRVAAEILQYEPEELLQRPLSSFFPAHFVHRVTDHNYEASSRALRVEEWITTKDGFSLYLGFGCSPLMSEQGTCEGYILSFQDLTEIKKREDEFQFREKMAAIGEMAAGLAHELRNPLGSLSGSIQVLKGELDLSQDQARLLDIVLRESERLNRIVADFLAYAGPHPVAQQTVELGPLVEDTLQLFQNSPEFDRDLHRVEMVPGPQSPRCLGNPDQLRQVVWNLLQNGIRAMPRGGRLRVQLVATSSHTRLRVSDEGIGMSSLEREKLFQPFHSGFRKGAGLGMAVVYQIVQQHRGEIRVHTSKGEGTEIEIRLPATISPDVPEGEKSEKGEAEGDPSLKMTH